MSSQSQPRSVRYREIAATLRAEIGSDRLSAGSVLPSEATLSDRFSASRVTVRRALEVLRDEGILSSRQGAGWFVTIDRLQQSLGRLGTIEDQLAASGRISTREIIDIGFGRAPAWVAEELGTSDVLIVHRRDLADAVPFARVTVWCPGELGAHLTRAQIEATPFYDALGLDLRGATQTIGAAAADGTDAAVLQILDGAPILRCTRVTTGPDQRPVLVSEHVFPAHLTEFVVDVAHIEASLSPDGIRMTV